MSAPRTRPPASPTETGSVPITERRDRRRPLAWLPWAVLGALTLLLALVLLVINAVDDDGPDGPSGDRLGQVGSAGSGINGRDGDGRVAGTEGGSTTGPQAGAPSAAASGAASAAPSGAAQGAAASLKVGDRALLPLASGSLTGDLGQPVTGTARVESVVSDEGFWVGSSAQERVFVHLTPQARKADGESPFQVRGGQTVEFTGRLVSAAQSAGPLADVTAQEGKQQVQQQGAYVSAERIVLAE